MSALHKAALAETDKGYEGDYLAEILQGYNAVANGFWEGGTFVGTFAYYTPLFTNAAEEKKVMEKVKKILTDLRINEIHDEYQKIRLIYDYVCQNTVYSSKGMNTNPPYTAYGILVEGKGVCAGISHAIYLLAKEAGLGCRIISADSAVEGEEGHAWNIVRIGNLYYYLDATWDLDNKKQGKHYEYFLKKTPFVNHGSSTFIVNKDAAFWKAHPLSTKDYPYKDKQPESESPAIPTWPHGKVERKGISLYWEKDPKVTSYEIFRSSDGMEPAKIGTSTSGKYTDTKVKSGVYYSYFLKAVSGDKTSELSEGNGFYFLTAPENLKARLSTGRTVILSWKKVKGATGYQIRYGTDKSFKSAQKVTIKSQKTLQKTIQRLKKNNYYFQIRALKKNGNKNWYSVWSKTESCQVK
jgi:hypothetical protein